MEEKEQQYMEGSENRHNESPETAPDQYTGEDGKSYYRFSDGNYYSPQRLQTGDKAKVKKKKKSARKNFLLGMLAGILVASLVLCGVFVYLGKSAAAGTDALTNEAVLRKIQVLEGIIDSRYYEENVDKDAMAEGIYHGMVEAVGDPYTEYFAAEEMSEFSESITGSYGGIGAAFYMDPDLNLPKLSYCYDGSPAQLAGLREGDVIYAIDGESAQGLSLDEVVDRIRGDEGTAVHLTMYREGETSYLEFDLERAIITYPTVSTEMLEDHIGYLRITSFDTVTEDQFTEGLADLRAQGMEGMILDLRGNPGGSVQTVTGIARQILPEGTIVYTVDRDGNREDITCDGGNELGVPLVVLVNESSASASEILTGAIQDYGVGTVIGTTTYGKGVVQATVPLSDGSGIKLTICKYFTPKGRDIHGVGLEPDIEVELDSEAYLEDGTDNQKDMAISELKKMMQ